MIFSVAVVIVLCNAVVLIYIYIHIERVYDYKRTKEIFIKKIRRIENKIQEITVDI